MSVNYELYRVFFHAAKHLSYTKAADELFVTQSSVSQSIKQLETALDSSLFYKSGRAVKLTHEGQLLLLYVEKALKNFEKGEAELRNLSKLAQGHISIGASDTISRYFLLPYIKTFHESYPDIQLSINNRPSPVSLEMVRRGELDFAVVNAAPSQTDPQLTYIKVSQTANVIIASAEYAEKHNILHKKLNLSTLINHPLITLEEKSTTRRLLNRFLEDQHIKWLPAFEGGSVDFILEMVAIHMGIGFIPDMAFGHWKDSNLVMLSTSAIFPKTDICIVLNNSIPMSRATDRLIDNIKSSAFSNT